MDCDKLFGKNFHMVQTGLLVVVVLGLLWMAMNKPKKAGFAEHASGLPSPGLGLGTSNVMGFYQGFDQLWGSGSSSYSAPDSDYRQVMHEYAPSDPAYQELNF
jgi:hypothetical protein